MGLHNRTRAILLGAIGLSLIAGVVALPEGASALSVGVSAGGAAAVVQRGVGALAGVTARHGQRHGRRAWSHSRGQR